MKRFTKILFVVGSAALLVATTAQAQVTSTSAAGALPPTAQVDITLTGTIQSSISLTITPGAGTAFSSTGGNGTPTASATFPFGPFNTMSTTLANGSISRATVGTPGAFVIAPLVARVTVSGSGAPPAVNMTAPLEAVAVVPGVTSPVQINNVRLQNGAGAWTNSAVGIDLTAGVTDFCAAVGGCTTSTDYAHTLGLFIPDTQVAGDFNQVVSYVATL